MTAISIVGPEGVPMRFEAATVSERAIAFGIDIAIIGVSVVLLIMAGLAATTVTFLAEPLAASLVGYFVIRHGYFAIFESVWQGTTPGKRALKLKVISRDGLALRTDSVIARNLMRDVELFVPLTVLAAPEQLLGRAPWWLLLPMTLWLLLMLVLPLLTKERTRIGDLVGGTIVIRVPEGDLLQDQAARTSLIPGAHVDAIVFTQAQLQVYGEAELETLAGLIRKAEEGKATQHDLQVVAQTIASKIQFGGPLPSADPNRFLRTFYKQQRAFLEKRLLFGERKADKFDR